MKSIRRSIESRKEQGRAALVPYIMCADPDYETTKGVLHTLNRAGATAVELGLPFTDPTADGLTIQQATRRALANGFSLKEVFRLVKDVRREGNEMPIALYTYCNLIFGAGYDQFYREAVEAGVQGTLIVDLPPEEARSFIPAHDHPLETIFLCSPTTSESRLRKINEASTAFTYYVARTGVTGVRDQLPQGVVDALKSLRRIVTKPLGVGFGISKPEHARMLAPYADAVVVGSAYVSLFERYQGAALLTEIAEFTESLVQAL